MLKSIPSTFYFYGSIKIIWVFPMIIILPGLTGSGASSSKFTCGTPGLCHPPLLTSSEIEEFDLSEEATSCSNQGISYLSFPILDQSVPPFSTSTFVFLEQLKSYLSGGKHIAIHCRQGLGRAALIAASVLVLSGFAPDQAFALLSTVRGHSVPETEEQKAWVMAFFQYHNQPSYGGPKSQDSFW